MHCILARRHLRAPKWWLSIASLTLLATAAHASAPDFTGQSIQAAIPTVNQLSIVNLRQLGVITGAGPLLVTPGSRILVDGQPQPDLIVSMLRGSRTGAVCL